MTVKDSVLDEIINKVCQKYLMHDIMYEDDFWEGVYDVLEKIGVKIEEDY